jgi:hypothetical protein
MRHLGMCRQLDFSTCHVTPLPRLQGAVCMLFPTCSTRRGWCITMLSGVAAMYSATSSHCTVPKPPTKYTSEIRFMRKHIVLPDSHRSLLSLLCFWAKICMQVRQL